MIFTKNIDGSTFEAEVSKIFETSIVTDNISAIDGSVTFLSDMDTAQDVDFRGNIRNTSGPLTVVSNIDMTGKNILNTNRISVEYLDSFTAVPAIHITDVASTTKVSVTAEELEVLGHIDLEAILTPGNAGIGVDGGRLWAEVGTEDIVWTTASDEIVLNDPYGQDLSNLGSPSFVNTSITNTAYSSNINTNVIDTNGASVITIPASLTIVGGGEILSLTAGNNLHLASRAVDNTATEILAVDGSDTVVIRDIASIIGQPIFGSEYAYIESRGVTATTSTTFILKTSLSVTVPIGIYRVDYSCLIQNSNFAGSSLVRFRHNAVDLNTSPVTPFSFDTAASPKPCMQFFELALTAGLHKFDLEFRATAATATITDANISIFRIM